MNQLFSFFHLLSYKYFFFLFTPTEHRVHVKIYSNIFQNQLFSFTVLWKFFFSLQKKKNGKFTRPAAVHQAQWLQKYKYDAHHLSQDDVPPPS